MKPQTNVWQGSVLFLIAAFALLTAGCDNRPEPNEANPLHGDCSVALRKIHEAKQQWARDLGRQPSDIPTDSDLFGPGNYLKRKPVCSHGGTHTLGSVNRKPTCSLAATMAGHDF